MTSAASAPHRHFGLVAVWIHIHAVIPGLRYHERDVRCVDFISVLVVHVPDVYNQRSLHQPNLRGLVTDLEQRDPSLRSQTERGRSNVQLRAGVFIRPKIVARHERTIELGSDPVVLTARLKRHRSLHVIQAGYAAWRILLVGILRVIL